MGRAGKRQDVVSRQSSGRHNRYGTPILLLELGCGHYVLRRSNSVRKMANCGICR